MGTTHIVRHHICQELLWGVQGLGTLIVSDGLFLFKSLRPEVLSQLLLGTLGAGRCHLGEHLLHS